MKMNPKLKDFVRANILPSKENPYILLDSQDVENCHQLIKKSGVSKDKATRLHQFVDETDNITYQQILRLKDRINYNRKDSGREQTEYAFRELFPNWLAMRDVSGIAQMMNSIDELNRALERNLLEIKEEN